MNVDNVLLKTNLKCNVMDIEPQKCDIFVPFVVNFDAGLLICCRLLTANGSGVKLQQFIAVSVDVVTD